MSYQRASDLSNGMVNGRSGPRQEYNDAGSLVGYIPDDVSSVHSSSLGGVGVPSAYPQMFSGFQDTWPTLNGRRPNGAKSRAGTESIAGESVAASESDINGPASTVDGKGGVSLAGLSINDAKQPSLTQADRLKRYVESSGRPVDGSIYGGSSASSRLPRADDEDARSVSTAFASQVGLGSYD